jgi:hypothetical protein
MEKYYPLRLDVMKSFTNISAEFTQNDTETCGFNIELTSYKVKEVRLYAIYK